MKIVLKNDSGQPTCVRFENEADLNINAGAATEIEVNDGAEINFKTSLIETKNIKRP